MKKYLFLFALIVAFVSVNQFSSAAAIENKKEQGYISLSNSIEKEVEPNLATITFAIENTADSASKATSENNIISNAIVNSLKSIADVNSDIIKTAKFSVRPVYASTVSGKRAIKNYMAVNSVTVETRNMDKVSKFIDTAIKNGANRTDNLYYSLENEKLICNNEYPALVKEMKDLASKIAQAASTQVIGVKNINVSCNMNAPRLYAKAMNSMDSISSEAGTFTPIESGKIKIRVYANADFYVN